MECLPPTMQWHAQTATWDILVVVEHAFAQILVVHAHQFLALVLIQSFLHAKKWPLNWHQNHPQGQDKYQVQRANKKIFVTVWFVKILKHIALGKILQTVDCLQWCLNLLVAGPHLQVASPIILCNLNLVPTIMKNRHLIQEHNGRQCLHPQIVVAKGALMDNRVPHGGGHHKWPWDKFPWWPWFPRDATKVPFWMCFLHVCTFLRG